MRKPAGGELDLAVRSWTAEVSEVAVAGAGGDAF